MNRDGRSTLLMALLASGRLGCGSTVRVATLTEETVHLKAEYAEIT